MILNIQLSDVGLVLDLIGVILLFAYGLAPLLSKDGSMSLSVGTSDYLKRKARRYETLSRMGVGLIFVGFAFQLLGNHIAWSSGVSLVAVLSMLIVLFFGILALKTVRRHWKRKYELRAQYIPQFDKAKPSHIGEHMWIFIIVNNSKRSLTATLHLKSEPSIVTLLATGKEPETIVPTRKVELKDIEPSKSVTIQVWGMGGHKTYGLDCYLQVDKKVVRPKISPCS